MNTCSIRLGGKHRLPQQQAPQHHKQHRSSRRLFLPPDAQALQDAEKMEGLILMWSVNFGPNLNETTDEGPRSPAATSLIRDAPRWAICLRGSEGRQQGMVVVVGTGPWGRASRCGLFHLITRLSTCRQEWQNMTVMMSIYGFGRPVLR